MGEPVANDGASDSADTAAVSSVARDTVVRRRGEASAEARGAAEADRAAPTASAGSRLEAMSEEMANLPDDDVDAQRALAMRMLTAAMHPNH